MAVTNSYISIFHVLFNSLLLLFFCYSNKLCVYGQKTNPYHIIETSMLLHDSTCSASTTDPPRRSQELQISHRYGPCSPLGQPKEYPSSREIFLKDEARVRSMNNALTVNSYHTDLESEAVVVPTSPIPVGAGRFTVSVGFGSPRNQFKLIFDTGSDVTWIKCTPCSKTSCYREKKLIFDPSKSFSYSNGSCIKGRLNDPKIRYADDSYASFRYGCDTLFLPPSDVIPKFQFGCGEDYSNDFDNVTGMLGLGQGTAVSLTSQASLKLGKVFSYCFPPGKSPRGYLLFGESAKAKPAASSLKFTPLRKNSASSHYYITLIGISVANERLKIDPSVFESPGTIIDSGTVITRLPQSAYSALQSAFKKSMSKYPPAPPLLGPLVLDTCYNLEGYKNVEIPEIVLHFAEGADVRLHPLGIVWTEKNSLSQVCLAFAKTTDKTEQLTIIGNNQQLTLKVLYDLEGSQIGFGADGCS